MARIPFIRHRTANQIRANLQRLLSPLRLGGKEAPAPRRHRARVRLS
jgi:hypothetical protein